MRDSIRTIGIVTVAALIVLLPALPARAQTQPAATSGTAGRIAKFVSGADLGNSVLFENNGRIGLGTTSPTSALDIRTPSALNLMSVQPFLTFRDTGAADAPFRIQSSGGGLTLLSQDALSAANRSAVVRIDKRGRLGIGTTNPQRLIQIGADANASFTIEASDAIPNAGYIRFGDGTGWQLHFGRSRLRSGGPLATGTTGVIMSIKDNSPSGVGGLVIFKSGVQLDAIYASGASPTPLCRNSLNLISVCSSSRRFKTDIRPFSGGMQLISQLQPVSFTWKEDHHPDIGLIAEDVAAVEPRLAFRSPKGVVEGVNYSQLTATLVNAVKEQQQQLERQQRVIDELLSAVARLEKGAGGALEGR